MCWATSCELPYMAGFWFRVEVQGLGCRVQYLGLRPPTLRSANKGWKGIPRVGLRSLGYRVSGFGGPDKN